MVAHSVETHLAVSPADYDAEILRFSPGYDAMLTEVGDALVRLRGADTDARILDLGAGTGALSGRLAERLPRASFTLLDADPRMLAHAQSRLAAHASRVTLHQGSFLAPLPECDVAVASLALHHVHDRDHKRALYRNIHTALIEGGLLFCADVTIPRLPALAEGTRARWAAHLVAHGDTEAQAYARFDQWSKEDRYFSIEEELDLMRAGGFLSVEVLWRFGPSSVMVAVA